MTPFKLKDEKHRKLLHDNYKMNIFIVRYMSVYLLHVYRRRCTHFHDDDDLQTFPIHFPVFIVAVCAITLWKIAVGKVQKCRKMYIQSHVNGKCTRHGDGGTEKLCFPINNQCGSSAQYQWCVLNGIVYGECNMMEYHQVRRNSALNSSVEFQDDVGFCSQPATPLSKAPNVPLLALRYQYPSD